jgi:hypothetical protein
VDDDVVRELPEWRDMILEFSRFPTPHPRSERDEAVNGISDNWALTRAQGVMQSEGYVLKLIF